MPTYEILLLTGPYEGMADTVGRHVKKLIGSSRNNINEYQMLGSIDESFDFNRFDGLIIHYTLIMASEDYIDAAARQKIRKFRGLKLAFIQDEYRFINTTVDAMADLGIGVLFSVCGPKAISQIYGHEKIKSIRKETTLTGYVPKDILSRAVKPYEERSFDVVYRARDLSGRFAWLGQIAAEKGFIGKRFKNDAGAFGLHCDISGRESDRIYGDAWFDFIAGARAMLGTESGASVCDFTGDIQRRVEERWFGAPETSFEEMKEEFFRDEDGKILATCISPRCFEAAALRTLMIMYPGDYSGILTPWLHYVPLQRDHANMKEVVAVLRDPARAGAIIDNAYNEIACNPKYHFSELARHFDQVFDEEFTVRGKALVAGPRGGAYIAAYRNTHRFRLAMKEMQRRVRIYVASRPTFLSRLVRLLIAGPKIWLKTGIYLSKVFILKLPYALKIKKAYDRRWRKNAF